MARGAGGLFARWERWRSHRRIASALALNKRGELRSDGLEPSQFHQRLEIEWRARGVHPWLRGRMESQRDKLFAEQCLNDTTTALEQLFYRLPQIDFINFTVLDPHSSAPILQGSISRKEAEAVTDASPGMRLKRLGATYRLSNWRFEPLG
jgi:hypothetical protein